MNKPIVAGVVGLVLLCVTVVLLMTVFVLTQTEGFSLPPGSFGGGGTGEPRGDGEDGGGEEVENILVKVDAPLFVDQQQEFTIRVMVTNTADHPQVLDSIDIGGVYIDGIAITASTPPYTENYYIGENDYNAWSYEYGVTIPVQGTVEMTYSAVALKPGDYYAPLNVCINDPSMCLYHSIRAVVSPRASGETPAGPVGGGPAVGRFAVYY